MRKTKISNPDIMMSVGEYRKLALLSLWVGLIVTVGVVFVLIPNVELVIFVAFLGGAALGPRNGLVAALLGEAMFSAFNPIGSGLGFPILYAFQIFSVGLSGLMGGVLATRINMISSPMLRTLFFGLVGFILTFIYDLLTTLSLPLSTGVTEGTIWGSVSIGLPFFVTHMVSNTILFTLFGAGMIQLIKRQLQMHGLEAK